MARGAADSESHAAEGRVFAQRRGEIVDEEAGGADG